MDAKTLVTTDLTTLANEDDPAPAVERFYSPDFIQHSPMLPAGRDSLVPAFTAFKSAGVKYELMRVVAEGVETAEQHLMARRVVAHGESCARERIGESAKKARPRGCDRSVSRSPRTAMRPGSRGVALST